MIHMLVWELQYAIVTRTCVFRGEFKQKKLKYYCCRWVTWPMLPRLSESEMTTRVKEKEK